MAPPETTATPAWARSAAASLARRQPSRNAAREPTIQYTGPFADSPDADFTVFAHLQSGKRAIVLANLGTTALQINDLHPLNNPSGPCRIYQPFEDDRNAQFPLALTLPPEHVAFVVEQ